MMMIGGEGIIMPVHDILPAVVPVVGPLAALGLVYWACFFKYK